jgi:hypothetical protein
MGQMFSLAKAMNTHGVDFSEDTLWRKHFALLHTPLATNSCRIHCAHISFVVGTTLNRFDMKWIEFATEKVLQHVEW